MIKCPEKRARRPTGPDSLECLERLFLTKAQWRRELDGQVRKLRTNGFHRHWADPVRTSVRPGLAV